MNALGRSILYLKNSVRICKTHPNLNTFINTLKYFRAWHKYNQPGRNSVTEQLPWLTFPAIHAIKKILKPEMQLFEFGSGGSTLFWSSRVKHIVSIEHDKEWFQLMEKEFKTRKVSNVEYFLIEAQPEAQYDQKRPDNPNDYISGRKDFSGKNFEAYAKKIDEYSDAYFDVVLVDGRARPSCIMHALNKIKKNGYLIVDNTERVRYLKPFNLDKKKWKKKNYPGPGTFNYNFSQTTIFQRIG